MKLILSYNNGYLSPILIADKGLGLPLEKLSFKDEFSYTYFEDNTIELISNFKNTSPPPESFHKYLKSLQEKRIISIREVKSFYDQYKERYESLPHIGKVPQNYTNHNYDKFDLWQDSFTKEIIHLKEIKNKYPKDEEINKDADYWLNKFKNAELLAHIHVAKNLSPYTKEKYKLKTNALKNPFEDCFYVGENNIVDWIALGLSQESKNQASIKVLSNTVGSLLRHNPELRPLLVITALWASVGVDARLGKQRLPLHREFLKIIESSNERFVKDGTGLYASKHELFLPSLQKRETDDTFVHELTHAVARIIYNHLSDLFPAFLREKKSVWTEHAEKFVTTVERQSLDKILNFNHYNKKEWSQEWVARGVERKYSRKNKPLKVNPEQDRFFDEQLQQFYQDIQAYCTDLIEETGLKLIQPLRENNFFFGKDSFQLDADSASLLNEAFLRKISVLDVYIQRALTKYQPATIVHYLMQEGKDISIYAIMQSAARNNHVELVKYILNHAKQLNFDIAAIKAIKALNLAASNGHAEIVALCLQHGIPGNISIANHTTVDSLTKKGENQLVALHYAAAHGHVDVVKLLLQHGANVEAQDENGDTALHLAAYEGHAEVAKVLLAAQADINKKNKSSKTPLHYAAIKGRKDLFELFLANKDVAIDGKDKNGNTPLHLLIEKSDLQNELSETEAKTRFQCIQLLLEKNADPNILNLSECSTLYLAVKNNLTAVVKLLLQKITNKTLNQQNLTDTTALQLAIASGQTEIATLLLQQPDIDVNTLNCQNTNALHLAIELDDVQLISKLLNISSLNPNLPDPKGFYPLEYFIKNKYFTLIAQIFAHENFDVNLRINNVPILNLFITSGLHQLAAKILDNPKLDINAPDSEGLTALHWAVKTSNKDIVELLLATEKFNLEAKNIFSETALHLAVASGQQNIAEMLITRGANINARDISQKTPFLSAIYHSKNDIALWFLQRMKNKIDLYAKDDCDNSALHYACEKNNFEICKALLATKIDIQAINNIGQTALHLAVINGHSAIVKLLLTKLNNKQIFIKDNDGKTAEDYAKETNFTEISKLITTKINENNASQSSASFWNQKNTKETAEIVDLTPKTAHNDPSLDQYSHMKT